MASWKAKDPDAVLDYQFDWSDYLLPGEALVSSIFIVANSPTLETFDTSIAGALTTFWARFGTIGDVARITNRITTSQGRVDDDTGTLRIRSSG